MLAPGGRVTVSLMLPDRPAVLPVAPPAAVLVKAAPPSAAGKRSVTVTPVAVLGPAFVTTTVYVVVVPGTAVVGPSVLLTTTSTRGVIVSESVASPWRCCSESRSRRG